MEELLECLHALELSDLPDNAATVLPVGTDPRIQRISSLASVVLITDEGQNRLENHRILKEKGFPVVAGEQDSFGWLSGIISTKKGGIVFG
jgi:hypothetical protein